MPTTWAWRLSNLARSSWKAATSRVQVGGKAPMNPNSTTLLLPWNWLNENFSAVVAGRVKSGALSPHLEGGRGGGDADHDDRGDQERRDEASPPHGRTSFRVPGGHRFTN